MPKRAERCTLRVEINNLGSEYPFNDFLFLSAQNRAKQRVKRPHDQRVFILILCDIAMIFMLIKYSIYFFSLRLYQILVEKNKYLF